MTKKGYIRTTIEIREDLHRRIRASGRTLSEAINAELASQMNAQAPLEKLFGIDKDHPVGTDDLREMRRDRRLL